VASTIIQAGESSRLSIDFGQLEASPVSPRPSKGSSRARLPRRRGNLELSADCAHGSSLDLTMSRDRSCLTALHPDVVRGAVPDKAHAVLAQPALKRTPAHSLDVLVATVPRRSQKPTKPVAKRLNHLVQRTDDAGLQERGNALGGSGFVREVVQSVKDIRPGLMLGPPLGDRCWEFRDLRGDPAVLIPCVNDRELGRITSIPG
jgi:hypothetical protein